MRILCLLISCWISSSIGSAIMLPPLSSIRGFGFDFERMNAPILHRLIQGVVDEPVPIQEVLSVEQIRDNPDAEMVHRARSIGDGHLRIRDGTSNVVGQHVRRDHEITLRIYPLTKNYCMARGPTSALEPHLWYCISAPI